MIWKNTEKQTQHGQIPEEEYICLLIGLSLFFPTKTGISKLVTRIQRKGAECRITLM